MMIREKESWLAAFLCCIYVVYSQAFVLIFIHGFDNGVSVLSKVYIAVFILVSVLITKKTMFSIILTIIVPIAIIARGFSEINYFADSLLSLLLLFPSIICGSIMLKDKLKDKSKDENMIIKIDEPIKNNKPLDIIISIVYSFAVAFFMIFINDNFNFNEEIVGIYKIIGLLLIFFHLISVLKKNEIACKISILFPYVILYDMSHIIYMYNIQSPQYISTWVSWYILNISVFIILFLLSLPHYNWKKKLKKVETVPDKVAKDDVDND
jgi:hypothetical protein